MVSEKHALKIQTAHLPNYEKERSYRKKTQVADLFYILLTHCRYYRKNKDQMKMVAA